MSSTGIPPAGHTCPSVVARSHPGTWRHGTLPSVREIPLEVSLAEWRGKGPQPQSGWPRTPQPLGRWGQCSGPQPYGAHENSLLCSSEESSGRGEVWKVSTTEKDNHRQSCTEMPHSDTTTLSSLQPRGSVMPIAVADSSHARAQGPASSLTRLSSARTGSEAYPHLLQGQGHTESHTHITGPGAERLRGCDRNEGSGHQAPLTQRGGEAPLHSPLPRGSSVDR